MTRLTFYVILCVVLSACTTEAEDDYCGNHSQFHAQHADDLGTLRIIMAADGTLSSELVLPDTLIVDDADELFQDAGFVYSLQTERECAAATPAIRRDGGYLIATYESSCGLDNKIGQLDVVLFDSLPEVDEIEVDVVTPVTQKHFAISRRCESAIFRLK